MIYAILEGKFSNKNHLKGVAEGLKTTQGIPLYERSFTRYNDHVYMYQIAIARVDDHQAECMIDLGYNVFKRTISRKDIRKRYKKIRYGKNK